MSTDFLVNETMPLGEAMHLQNTPVSEPMSSFKSRSSLNCKTNSLLPRTLSQDTVGQMAYRVRMNGVI